jgi:hypothetical protein
MVQVAILHYIPLQAVGRNDLGEEGVPIHEKQKTSTMLVHIRQLKLITCNANQHLAESEALWARNPARRGPGNWTAQ